MSGYQTINSEDYYFYPDGPQLKGISHQMVDITIRTPEL
ncbi:MAG: hypothetical protein ACLU93_03865 [Streptococcus sp.]